jgi:uroporphyrinogen-III synthase
MENAETHMNSINAPDRTSVPDNDPNSPLAGHTIVVTHARDQAEEQIRRFKERGAEVLYYPAIEITPFDKNEEFDAALREAAAGNYDWLVLNDADTILVVAERMKAAAIDPSRLPRRLKVAAIGCMTEQWTDELLGIRADFAPEIYTPQLVAEELKLKQGDRVLLPQSSHTRATLAKCLVGTGADVSAVNAYRTTIGRGGDDVLPKLWEGAVDAVTFTFPSAVRYFARRIKAEGGSLAMLDGLFVACIGPLTRQAAEDLGIHVDAVPPKHTIAGLVDVVTLAFVQGRP